MEFPRFDGRVEVSGASAGQDLDCAVAAAALWPIGLWGLRERSHFAGLLIWPDRPGLRSRLSRVIGASGWSGD